MAQNRRKKGQKKPKKGSVLRLRCHLLFECVLHKSIHYYACHHLFFQCKNTCAVPAGEKLTGNFGAELYKENTVTKRNFRHFGFEPLTLRVGAGNSKKTI